MRVLHQLILPPHALNIETFSEAQVPTNIQRGAVTQPQIQPYEEGRGGVR